MSQADISIFASLLIRKDQLIAGLMDAKDDMRKWGEDITSNPIDIGFSANLSNLRAAIDTFRDAQESEPITIPVILDARAAMDSFAAMRSVMSEGSVPAGGGGGFGGVTNMATNVSSASVGGASPFSTMGAAAFGPLFAGPGAFGSPIGQQMSLQFGQYDPSALAQNWGPGPEFMAAMENAATGNLAAGIYGPQSGASGSYANFIPMGIGGRGWAAGAQQSGFGSAIASPAGGGFAAGAGGIRGMFRIMMAIRAGVDTAEAAGNLGGEIADYSSNPEGAEKFRLAGEKDISHIPLIGGILKDVGEMPNRTLSALINGIGQPKGTGIESDLAYGDRVQAQAKAENIQTVAMHRQAAAILRREEHFERQTAAEEYGTRLDGLSGTDRADAMQKFGMEDIDAEFKGAEYRSKEGGPLTAAAAELRQAKVDRLNTDIQKVRRQGTYETAQFNMEYGGRQATNDDERMGDFREKEDVIEAGIRVRSSDDANKFHVFRRQREEEEQQRLTRNTDYDTAQSQDRVTAVGNTAAEAAMRAKGQLYAADTMAFNASQDDQIKKLQERYDLETDTTKKANLQKEITATKAAQVIEASARETMHRVADENVAQGMAQKSRELTFQATGDSYNAQLSSINFNEAQAYGEFVKKGDTESARAALRYGAAQRLALNMGENEKYEAMKIGGEEDLLRAAHRGGEADVLALRAETAKRQRDAGDDPVKMATVNALAHASAAEMRKELRDSAPSRYGMTIEQSLRFDQDQIDRGPGIKAALKALNRFEGDVNQSGINGPIDANDRGFVGDLKSAGKDLAAAAKQLANLPKVYVVGATN